MAVKVSQHLCWVQGTETWGASKTTKTKSAEQPPHEGPKVVCFQSLKEKQAGSLSKGAWPVQGGLVTHTARCRGEAPPPTNQAQCNLFYVSASLRAKTTSTGSTSFCFCFISCAVPSIVSSSFDNSTPCWPEDDLLLEQRRLSHTRINKWVKCWDSLPLVTASNMRRKLSHPLMLHILHVSLLQYLLLSTTAGRRRKVRLRLGGSQFLNQRLIFPLGRFPTCWLPDTQCVWGFADVAVASRLQNNLPRGNSCTQWH